MGLTDYQKLQIKKLEFESLKANKAELIRGLLLATKQLLELQNECQELKDLINR